eukprot:6193271-Pleurochrysis_carterae.AAC.5
MPVTAVCIDPSGPRSARPAGIERSGQVFRGRALRARRATQTIVPHCSIHSAPRELRTARARVSQTVHFTASAACVAGTTVAWPENGAERGVDDGQQLEAHDERRHDQVERLRHGVGLLVERHLRQAVPGKAGEQGL